MTTIEWTHRPGSRGETWNPLVGCSILTPGCTSCYAMRMAARIESINAAAGKHTHYAGTTRKVKGKAVWTGKVALAPLHILTAPLRWKSPRTVFVNSMADLFHENVPDEWIDQVFAIMALSPQHTFQVLTKRAKRMREYLSAARAHPVGLAALEQTFHSMSQNPHSNVGADVKLQGDIANLSVWPLPNVWLGVSAERQQEADERIPELLAAPAAIRFVSAEPLLGPLDISRWLRPVGGAPGHCFSIDGDRWHDFGGCRHCRAALDWVIVGGESGQDARPMRPDWARALRDQCADADVSFFFKQWGAHAPASIVLPDDHLPQDRDVMLPVSKKAAGRLLDGVEHNGMPAMREVSA